ncbi:uncharacterized protein LOC128720302 [Anopheles nili]|uniref:uncharacterized protein LOC128720302 n=1 Tax=Anopheles nili TaxID=185578 RepID=UPI00237B7381|nr:uncharacterized protein LOC128720302 [Anopheles nili]
MNKLFDECEWEKNLPAADTSFCFSKNTDKNKARNTKSISNRQIVKANNRKSINNENSAGWSVLLKKNESGTNHSEKKSKAATNGMLDNKIKNGKGNNSQDRKRKVCAGSSEIDKEPACNNGNNLPMKKTKSNEVVKTNGRPTNRISQLHNGVKCSAHAKVVAKGNKRENLSAAARKPKNLKDTLMERLKGPRFRFINEQLYKTTGEQAKALFQEDPSSFDAYHEGYRLQVAQWPMNPLNRMIRSILKLPKSTVVADFGCGDATLAASIPNQVYSLDLVSKKPGVIACDMANTPLESNFVNVVVFCLSLMGTNLADFLLEANRVLKVGGLMKIAEVSSRFDNVNEFVNNVQRCGFSLENKDMKQKLFYFFNFKKERTVLKGSIKIKPFSLKPCLYKKR